MSPFHRHCWIKWFRCTNLALVLRKSSIRAILLFSTLLGRDAIRTTARGSSTLLPERRNWLAAPPGRLVARDLAGGSAPGWHLNFLCRPVPADGQRELRGSQKGPRTHSIRSPGSGARTSAVRA